MAPYSGPTTIAPTIRISELLRIPIAPISPAMTSSEYQLWGVKPLSRESGLDLSPNGRELLEPTTAASGDLIGERGNRGVDVFHDD